jgi:flagellar biosynthesis/type III secretory pathway protein FliH
MTRVSLKTLQLEAAENSGYAKGYQDGHASGCTAGRQQGIEITQRRTACALLEIKLPPAVIAQVTNLAVDVLES